MRRRGAMAGVARHAMADLLHAAIGAGSAGLATVRALPRRAYELMPGTTRSPTLRAGPSRRGPPFFPG